MKREIKFRGYSNEHGWIYGDLLQYPNGETYIMEHSNGEILSYIVESDTVGQYTGMKDSKGKRIFEGDILGGDGCAHVIQYKEDEAKFVAVLEGRQDLPCGIDQRWINEFKKVVGGSIQERPEIFNF